MAHRLLSSVLTMLSIVVACSDAKASACDQQAKCFNVCEEFTTIGSPECKSACSPAITICEKEKNKQSHNKPDKVMPVAGKPVTNMQKPTSNAEPAKQGIAECAWNRHYRGELYCKDYSPGLVNYNGICGLYPQDIPLRRQLEQAVISRCTPETYEKGLKNTGSQGYKFQPVGFIPRGMTILVPNSR